MAGGMRDGGVHGGVCGRGHAWQGGMHTTCLPPRHHEIRSVNARAVRIQLESILVPQIFLVQTHEILQHEKSVGEGEGG